MHYPGIKPNEPYTVGEPPERVGYETIHIAKENGGKNDVPLSYSDAMKMADARDWLRL